MAKISKLNSRLKQKSLKHLDLNVMALVSKCKCLKSPYVAIAYWVQSDRTGKEWMEPPYDLLELMNVSPVDLWRSLGALEREGLIAVIRQPGHPSKVRWRLHELGGSGDDV
jgi:hypothetical protein